MTFETPPLHAIQSLDLPCEPDLLRDRAARFHVMGLSNRKIAGILRLPESVVSTLLTEARREGIIQVTLGLSPNRVKDLAQLDEPAGLTKVLKSLKHRFPSTRVPDLFVVPAEGETIDLRLKSFARGASRLLVDLLQPAGTLGVTFGYTVWSIGREISLPSRRHWPAVVSALVGEPDGIRPDEAPWASSDVAWRYYSLRSSTGSNEKSIEERAFYSLRGAPAYLEAVQATRNGFKDARELLLRRRSYRKVFGPDGVLRDLDAMLTSVGACENDKASQSSELVYPAWVNEFEPLCDIGGHVLCRSRFHQDKVAERWTGPSLQDLRRIAGRADVGKPGVIIAAIDASKVVPLMVAILLGTASSVILDPSLAHTLDVLARGLDDGASPRTFGLPDWLCDPCWLEQCAATDRAADLPQTGREERT